MTSIVARLAAACLVPLALTAAAPPRRHAGVRRSPVRVHVSGCSIVVPADARVWYDAKADTTTYGVSGRRAWKVLLIPSPRSEPLGYAVDGATSPYRYAPGPGRHRHVMLAPTWFNGHSELRMVMRVSGGGRPTVFSETRLYIGGRRTLVVSVSQTELALNARRADTERVWESVRVP